MDEFCIVIAHNTLNDLLTKMYIEWNWIISMYFQTIKQNKLCYKNDLLNNCF